jgi:hypothetical protein
MWKCEDVKIGDKRGRQSVDTHLHIFISSLCAAALKNFFVENSKKYLQVKNIVLYLQQFFVLLQMLFEILN